MDAALTDAFEANRSRLRRLAYRMLGSVSEAEDAVQDAWLRWSRAGNGVGDPAAWLVRATTRLCIDRLRAAKAEREAYRGPWLPEPLVEPVTMDPLERAEDVSVAFLLALERLSPLERAVFLLRDVFDEDFAAIAQTLDRSEAAVRQLASRARAHVQDGRPRFSVSADRAHQLAAAFVGAIGRGDARELKALLAEDAVMLTDGGGKRTAALRALVGAEDVIGLILGVRWRQGYPVERMAPAWINGLPGFVIWYPDGPSTISVQPTDSGRVGAIYVVRNPEKLAHIG